MDGEPLSKQVIITKRPRVAPGDAVSRLKGRAQLSDLRGGIVHEAITERVLNTGREMLRSRDPQTQALLAINMEIDAEIDGYATSGAFTPQEIHLMRATRHVEATVRAIEAQKLAELDKARLQALEHIAGTDPLLGIPNRRRMHDEMELQLKQAKAAEDVVVVGVLDTDGLTYVNNKHGHDGGDIFLIGTAEKLHAAITRAGGMVARIGGDEFGLMVRAKTREEGVGVMQYAHAVLKGDVPEEESLLGYLQKRDIMRGRTEPVSGSLGVVTVQPSDEERSPRDIFRKADIAEYTAKALGVQRQQRGQFVEYTEGMVMPEGYERQK